MVEPDPYFDFHADFPLFTLGISSDGRTVFNRDLSCEFFVASNGSKYERVFFVFTDRDLAEQFTEAIERDTGKVNDVIEIETPRDVISALVHMKKQGATHVGIDCDARGKSRGFVETIESIIHGFATGSTEV